MMAVTAQTRVFVCVTAVDFRKGIDGLARVCRDVLSADPFLCIEAEYAADGPAQAAKLATAWRSARGRPPRKIYRLSSRVSTESLGRKR